jgi:hypothetical protein
VLPLSKGENSGSNFKKRPKDSLKSLIIDLGKLDGNDILNSLGILFCASKNSKQAMKYEGETLILKPTVGIEGEIQIINDKLSQR